MGSRLTISVIALLAIHLQSSGKLIRTPRDTAAKLNESTYFNCSTSLKAMEVFWYHGGNLVYTGDKGGVVYEGYGGRVSIDVDNDRGASNLVIHSVQPKDAGEYACWDGEGSGDKKSAQLIVLSNDPLCESNIDLNEIIGQNTCNLNRDKVQVSCSVTYHGNNPPRLEWKKTGDNNGITGKIYTVSANKSYITCTLLLENDIELHNSSYVCLINGTAENQYKCASGVIALSYSVDSGEVVSAFKGAHLTCVANTTFDCKYRWFRGNDSICPVSCRQYLTADFLGEYHCEAKCSVRGKDCTFVAMKVFVSPGPELAVEGIGGYPAILAIGILGTCLLGAAGVAIFFYRNPRKPKTIAEAIELIAFSSDLLDHADPKDKAAFLRKTGRDRFVISDCTKEILGQLCLGQMFPATTNNDKDKLENPELLYCDIDVTATKKRRSSFLYVT